MPAAESMLGCPPGEAARKTSVVSVSESENWDEETSVVSRRSKKKGPARSPVIISATEELAKLGGGYLSLAKELLGGTKLVATGRKVVTDEDLAVFLMILRFFRRT